MYKENYQCVLKVNFSELHWKASQATSMFLHKMTVVSLKTSNMKQAPGAMEKKDHMSVDLSSHCRILRSWYNDGIGVFLPQEVSNIKWVLSGQMGALSAHTLEPAALWLLGNGSNQQSGDWLSGGGYSIGRHVSTWRTLRVGGWRGMKTARGRWWNFFFLESH